MQHELNPQAKRQLIDDDSQFRIQELEGLMAKGVKNLDKSYHIISVIGSQSSGKSTLLNALFSTDFEVLNRKMKVGQTTKGIWYSMDLPTKTMILDVEGSDSNERQQRTKIQRRNSLFALAVSHTLLINMWIQQIGLYKGSQMAILEIILELNMKLFGVENPKQIVFVVRDFSKERQNEEALREKLFGKVEEAWNNMPKPPNKSHIKLSDLFTLNAFFLPSKLDEKQQFQQACGKLKKELIENAPSRGIYNNNVAMKDFPVYLKNLWETIDKDKDINLPQEKILLSNMKCQQAKKNAYQTYEEEFRDELQKSQRKLNLQFKEHVEATIHKMMTSYNEDTSGYIPQEIARVRQQFELELQRKVQISFSYQVKHIVDQCIKEFNENVNTLFIRDKNIESIKALQPEVVKKFTQCMDKVALKPEWAEKEIQKFSVEVDKSFNTQKEKIVINTLQEFDRSLKKKVENLVSNAFYDKKIFCDSFWKHISTKSNETEHRVKNSILELYKKLQFKEAGSEQTSISKANEYIEKAKQNAHEQLRTVIKMKCHDLVYYIMKHFKDDFNKDENETPNQWRNFTPQQINGLYERVKDKYLNLVSEFSSYELRSKEQDMTNSRRQMDRQASTLLQPREHDQLLSSAQLMALNTKLKQQMKQEYEEALQKNKQVVLGRIPKWAWFLFCLVAIDDIILWVKSPYLLIPLIVLLLLVIIIFLVGGKDMAMSLVNTVRSQGIGMARNVATQAAGKLLKND